MKRTLLVKLFITLIAVGFISGCHYSGCSKGDRSSRVYDANSGGK